MVVGRAVYARKDGTLELAEVQVGDPGVNEIRVRVRASGVNRADALQRRGLYPAPAGAPADILGLELAGEVDAVGRDVREWRVGDRVMGIVGGGAFATHVVIHEKEAARVPETITLEDAAAIPEAFITAHDALVTLGGLGHGMRALVHGAGSGVGTAAIQIAKRVGATVAGTSRTAEKLARLRPLGLERGVVVSDGASFATNVREAFGGNGADVILDTVGAAYARDNLDVLAPRGRWIVVGLLGGTHADVSFGDLMRKRASIIGTVLRSRSHADKVAATSAFVADILPAFSRGALSPVVSLRFPMEKAADALDALERNTTFGKIVLTWT